MGVLETVMQGDALSRSVAALLLAMSVASWVVIFWKLRLMRRAHLRASALPLDLVEATTRANSACEKVWREAKAAAEAARRGA